MQHKHKSTPGQFTCEKCSKTFTEESKLQAHMRNHFEYPCNQCDKQFRYQTKHITATHGNLKIYFHYFNNDQICPFSDQCIF